MDLGEGRGTRSGARETISEARVLRLASDPKGANSMEPVYKYKTNA